MQDANANAENIKGNSPRMQCSIKCNARLDARELISQDGPAPSAPPRTGLTNLKRIVPHQ